MPKALRLKREDNKYNCYSHPYITHILQLHKDIAMCDMYMCVNACCICYPIAPYHPCMGTSYTPDNTAYMHTATKVMFLAVESTKLNIHTEYSECTITDLKL